MNVQCLVNNILDIDQLVTKNNFNIDTSLSSCETFSIHYYSIC